MVPMISTDSQHAHPPYCRRPGGEEELDDAAGGEGVADEARGDNVGVEDPAVGPGPGGGQEG